MFSNIYNKNISLKERSEDIFLKILVLLIFILQSVHVKNNNQM